MNELLHSAIKAAINAGHDILKIYDTNFKVEIKQDNTPVTMADKAASKSIINSLSSFNIPFICEEENIVNYETRKNWQKLWLIDPLDGTKEFIKRNGEFTVNIALIEYDKPVIGVIYSPVFKNLFFALNGLGSFKINPHNVISLINTNKLDCLKTILNSAQQLPTVNKPKNYTVVASRSHLSTELNSHIKQLESKKGTINLINTGSSLKMCLVADGEANEYPRFGTTMEWDTAAGHCILNNANGTIISTETNLPLTYNKQNLKNPNFIATQINENI